MTKQVLYTYLGTNGTITSPVHLEDIYYVRKYRLIADDKHCLMNENGEIAYTVVVPEEELDSWYELKDNQ